MIQQQFLEEKSKQSYIYDSLSKRVSDLEKIIVRS